MARPSKLSEEKWAEVIRQHANGTSAAELARKYKVHPSQITRRVSQPAKQVKAVAVQVAEAEIAFERLPISQQGIARTLADRLKGMTSDMLDASEIHARNAARLAQLAQVTLDQVDDEAVALGLESAEEPIKRVMRLTTVSNEAAKVPLGLMAANKEAAKGVDDSTKTLGSLLGGLGKGV